MAQEHATVAEEEYLQIMFWLEEAGLPITGANIARAMQLSAADRARDDRPARARRLRGAARGQVARLHRRRAASTPRRSSAATA